MFWNVRINKRFDQIDPTNLRQLNNKIILYGLYIPRIPQSKRKGQHSTHVSERLEIFEYHH